MNMETEKITLKEKCKSFQKNRDYYLDSDKYILAHIDGRSFSKMIKNRFDKPFDDTFINAMNETAKYICENVQGVKMAYTQSDEISLLIKKNNPEGDVFFGGRMCKMQSIIAALATSKFCQIMTLLNLRKMGLSSTIDDCIEKLESYPLYQFDCKVFDVDSANDAMAWFLFRSIDCIRNSKQQTAQTYLPHKKLENKSSDEQIEMLKNEKGIDWSEFEDGKKYGRFIIKTTKHYNGEYGEYDRSIWETINGFDLTNAENRNKLMEICPTFKESIENE